jgi:hypothetical protein
VSATQTSSHLLKGGFAALDAATGQVVRILPFQYNPHQLVHTVGPDGETFALVAEYDAADGLEADQATVSERGIAPQLAALRAIVADRPSSALAFVWGPSRIAPVEVLSLTVTETMFDSRLHPLAATVAIELRVATAGAESGIGGRLATTYAREQQRLASLIPAGTLAALGIDGLE